MKNLAFLCILSLLKIGIYEYSLTLNTMESAEIVVCDVNKNLRVVIIHPVPVVRYDTTRVETQTSWLSESTKHNAHRS